MNKAIRSDLLVLKVRFGLSIFAALVSNRGIHALIFYRISNYLYKKRIPFCPLLLTRIIQIVYSIDIDYRCTIYGGIIIIHGDGIVIGQGAIIGSGTVIYHQVTLGIKGSGLNEGFPTIKDNCVLGSGAKLLGNIVVGSGSIIGANCVVTSDIPPMSIVKSEPIKIYPLNR
ncbi:MAG: hypothetical protein QM786_01345 [Breznakibacter sp.]